MRMSISYLEPLAFIKVSVKSKDLSHREKIISRHM